jgi:hypothetical protein
MTPKTAAGVDPRLHEKLAQHQHQHQHCLPKMNVTLRLMSKADVITILKCSWQKKN